LQGLKVPLDAVQQGPEDMVVYVVGPDSRPGCRVTLIVAPEDKTLAGSTELGASQRSQS
jgi:hypothetical protein